MLVKVPYVSVGKDHGDGSSSIRIYNNIDELVKDHYDYKEGCDFNTFKEKLLEDMDDCPYENGYLDSGYIELDIDFENKIVKSIKPFCVSMDC